MTNKLYIKIKKILKENTLIFISLIVIVLTFIKLPYYINAPGGITNLDNKIEIEDEYKSKGTFNMAYVYEYRANIFTILYGLINPNVDIIKKEDYLANNDTYETMKFREDKGLKESTDNAIILGYNLANEKVSITSCDVYVTYVYEIADTDIIVGDKIFEVDGHKISSLDDLKQILSEYEVNTKLDIKVTNNGNEYTRYAYVKEIGDSKVIGVYITLDKEYSAEKNINLKFKKNESGSSGGLMMTLEIYNELIEEDLTKGYKIVGTGTINANGDVGTIGGVKYKLLSAIRKHADIFFVPSGENYEEAIREASSHNYKIEIVPVSNIYDALNYLKNK